MTTIENASVSTSPVDSITECNKKTHITISKLGPFDVLCGRDKKCSSNVGNRRFRVLISANLSRYLNCETKFERSKAIGAIAKELQDDSCGAIRFFKRVKAKGSDAQGGDNDDDALIELLDEKRSREKVAHALRDYASQHRIVQTKQQSVTSPTIPQPELNRIVSDLSSNSLSTPSNHHNDPNFKNSTFPIRTHPHRLSPRLSELMKVQEAVKAELETFEQSENSSSSMSSVEAPMRLEGSEVCGDDGSEGYDNFDVRVADVFEVPAYNRHNESINEDNHQDQPQDEESESEGYDDFDVRVAPLPSGISLRHMDIFEVNKDIHQSENHHQQQQQQQQQSQDLSLSDLMQISMSTLSLHPSEFNGSSYAHMESDNLTTFDQSKIDMSSQQSKLDMSCMTLDESKLDMSSQQSKLVMSCMTLDESILDMSLQQSKLDLSCMTLDASAAIMADPPASG